MSRKKKPKVPDEIFTMGGLEVARYGRIVLMKMHASKEQHDELMKRIASDYDKVISEIDSCVSLIAEIVSRCDPVSLLKRAWWNNARLLLKIESEDEMGNEEMVAARMVDYVQAVIVSFPRESERRQQPSEEDWSALSKAVEKLFSELSLSFHLVRLARKKAAGETLNEAMEDYYFEAQNYWCNVRGTRYMRHNLPYFQTLLGPHDAILREVVGCGVGGVLRLITEVERRHTRGLGEAVRELKKLWTTAMAGIEREHGPDLDKAGFVEKIRASIERSGGQARFEQLIERLFGEGLFELKPGDGVSKELLDALSLGPGADPEFFADGEFKGWPLRVWPNWRKPFICVDGRCMCFDYVTLMDNLYRVLQRLVVKARPHYQEEWNRKQKVVSETWPIDLLSRMLPGAAVTRNVFYPHPDPAKAGNWCELDALIQYDDALFVVEVKAGTFCRKPPTTNFDAYIQSLRDLIENPSNQAGRFIAYLESMPAVALYDANHLEIGRLRLREIGHIVPTAISLDNLSEMASRAKHLRGLGISVGPRRVWTVSIEDLMVYEEILRCPLEFLHFTELRLLAFTSHALELINDELDHLGLYLQHNNYILEAEERASGSERIRWFGYRESIDKYFHALLSDATPPAPPAQKMPLLLREVLDVMARQQKPGRRRMASHLLGCGGASRANLWSTVTKGFARQQETGRPCPAASSGDSSITVFCWERGKLERRPAEARQHALAVMSVAGQRESQLLEITFDRDGSVADVDWSFLSLDSLSPESQAEAERAGRALAERRLDSALGGEKRKIGRNDPCPCGGGRKYKKCHGR